MVATRSYCRLNPPASRVTALAGKARARSPRGLRASLDFRGRSTKQLHRLFRVATAAAISLVAFPVAAADQPQHYFSGHVCRASETSAVYPGDHPCDLPLRGVTVTLRNSAGLVVVAKTDAKGWYSVTAIPLFGTEGDFVSYEAPQFVALKVPFLRYPADLAPDGQAGVTILLQQQHTLKVTVH